MLCILWEHSIYDSLYGATFCSCLPARAPSVNRAVGVARLQRGNGFCKVEKWRFWQLPLVPACQPSSLTLHSV